MKSLSLHLLWMTLGHFRNGENKRQEHCLTHNNFAFLQESLSPKSLHFTSADTRIVKDAPFGACFRNCVFAGCSDPWARQEEGRAFFVGRISTTAKSTMDFNY